MVCCTLLYAHSSIAIILMGKRELVALLNLSSWCLVMVERLFSSWCHGVVCGLRLWYFLIILTYYFRTDSRLSHWGSLNTFYWNQIIVLDYVVVNKHTKLFSSHGGFLRLIVCKALPRLVFSSIVGSIVSGALFIFATSILFVSGVVPCFGM